MDKEKVYVLQKDLPDGKAGDVYAVTNNSEFLENISRKDCEPLPEYWMKITDWFKLKEEVKPTVYYYGTTGEFIDFINEKDSYSYRVTKERLAEILIAEKKGELTIWRIKQVKTYTEKEYLQFGEDCFNAANYCKLSGTPPYYEKMYKTFSDYMNRKNK